MSINNSTSGITIVTLVVTIVFLLILAGVSIAMLIGENGLLTQVSKSKEAIEKAQKEEQAQLADFNSYIENGGESIFDTTTGANNPVLTKGMIPVKWDTTKNERKWKLGNLLKNRYKLV